MSLLWRLIVDADLRSRNTFGVAARAPWLIEVRNSAALGEVLALPELQEPHRWCWAGAATCCLPAIPKPRP